MAHKSRDKYVSLPKIAGSACNYQRRQQPKSHASPGNIRMRLRWDRSRNQRVAVKTIKCTGSSPFAEDLVSRLVAFEVAAMDRIIPHPNVVRLLEVPQASPAGACLVMEADALSRGDLMQTINAAPKGR